MKVLNIFIGSRKERKRRKHCAFLYILFGAVIICGAADKTVYGQYPFLLLDFSNNNLATQTEPGFTSFTIADSGSVIDGIKVEIAALTGSIDARWRGAPIGIPYELIYRDFVFTRPGGMRVTLSGLEANETYQITIYAYDTSSTAGGDRIADWTANGEFCLTAGFSAGTAPVNADDYGFSGMAQSDPNGTIVLEAGPNENTTEESGASNPYAFVNALVVSSMTPVNIARRPVPEDGSIITTTEVTLQWTPGNTSVSSNVYVGESFEDVNNATTANTDIFRGNSVEVSFPIGSAGRPYPDGLTEAQTYYWRIDEVEESGTANKGNIWSFTVELFVYPIKNIIATASSSEPGKEAVNTVNGSGLDDSGLLHSNESVGTMWLSSEGGEQPTRIEFEFDRVHKLYELWVWNSNDSLERLTGLGFKEVKIEYSVDGIDYMTLGTTHQFTQAPGTPDYAHNTTIDMEGVAAKYVRLTAISNFKGIFEQFGLSEVRFFSIPVSAREPSPTPRATDVGLDLILGWSEGREAARHDVYFGDDLQAVIDDIEPAATVTEGSYGPVSLDVGTTYYWRVDEVNDAETPAMWKGDIWDFTTVEYLTVDDFESYDAGENQIWYAWKDGLGYGTPDTPPYYAGNGTGAAVGDELTESFTEETIVHSGKQSMPLSYDNNKQGYLNYSEATMTLSSQRDWTARGVAELSLWFRGYPASVGSFVEEPVGTYTITASGEDIWNEADQFHYAFKQLTGVGSITARIESIENTNVWAKAGVMIRETLDAGSRFAGIFITPVNGCSFQARTDTGTAAISDSTVWTEVQQSVTAPYWVKLERDVTGGFKGYFSEDGVNWQTMIWKPNVSMGSNVYIGLALTSHDVALTCEAKFSGVQTTGTVTGQWLSQDIGILSNSAESMYVAVGNSAGAPAIVYHDDPAATQIGTWTEWIIPLKAFENQGINLADVDNISIGIGDRNNPQPGGSGKIFFDDIRLYGPRDASGE